MIYCRYVFIYFSPIEATLHRFFVVFFSSEKARSLPKYTIFTKQQEAAGKYCEQTHFAL